MPQYMLLLYDDPSNWQKLSPEETQQAMGKYMAWGQKPFIKGGMRLTADAGRVVRTDDGGKTAVTDGPYSETKEVLGGYYLIEAADYDEASRLSMDHPHLEYNGTIELRQTFSQ